ncbi:diguanylate cyclase (GGDEF) domain-containing protein [Alkalispirochaeta americana]|uniref:Diguanylate cyclase (GGDEF) domain-containing protein n=1 Tax=Alkalispirochaeta americana TaxID=159291 RepID=A0A1N6RFV8_9SPIO|nr:response regulator [Alkalispirochaeta americana]SIQ27572.1 diguanylate cyclase (GGDEF) domain-containing protein [Alkalispirochaeta americana]
MNDIQCPTTGLPAGSALEKAIQNLVEHNTSNGWILFIHVDRIEYINTFYTRKEGDETLYRIAQILSRIESSHLYRFAGPIFVMTLTGNTAKALDVAEQLRRAVGDSTELIENLTVSIGLVAADEAESAMKIQDIALDRLKTARRRGGNTICAISHSDEDSEYSSKTVLLVDPESDMLTVLIREIENKGFSVITAQDGLEALQVVSQISPDVIISELTVPKLGGFELRARLRQSEELGAIPFVLLSHRWNDELIREASSLRILHYHQKPLSAVHIAELVKNLAVGRFREEESGCV